MILRQAFQFRLELSSAQRRLCAQFAGCCRLVWNKALALQKELLDQGAGVLSYSKLTALLPEWKRSDELSFLREVPSQSLQQSLKCLDRATKDAFNKSSPKQFPRFKRKGRRDSFRYRQGFKLDEVNSRIFLPKLGWIRYRKSRNILGIPKNITVSKRGDYWFASIQTEREVQAPVPCSKSMIGGDLGIARFLTLSNGEYFPPLNSFRFLEDKLKKLQKKFSRKVKGSSNWKKLGRKISKLHIRIADARQDYLPKLSHYLSKNHAAVVLEDLKVANMSKSAKGTIEEPGKNVKAKSGLNKSILDQGWHEFKRQLGYKLEWQGGLLVLVDPRNTSRRCPDCGYTSGENRKTQASFVCIECGYKDNADFVGALNVLRAGHAQLACGENPLGISANQEPARIACA